MNLRPDGPKPPALPAALHPDIQFSILPLWSNMWSKAYVRGILRDAEGRKAEGLQGIAGFRFFSEGRGCYMLPNHPRYQLRYTRICCFVIIHHPPLHRKQFLLMCGAARGILSAQAIESGSATGKPGSRLQGNVGANPTRGRHCEAEAARSPEVRKPARVLPHDGAGRRTKFRVTRTKRKLARLCRACSLFCFVRFSMVQGR